jgi:hypothetical protein
MQRSTVIILAAAGIVSAVLILAGLLGVVGAFFWFTQVPLTVTPPPPATVGVLPGDAIEDLRLPQSLTGETPIPATATYAVKVAAFSDGRMTLDGKAATAEELKAHLDWLKDTPGEIWIYGEKFEDIAQVILLIGGDQPWKWTVRFFRDPDFSVEMDRPLPQRRK